MPFRSQLVIYVNAFVLGAAVMGFEMIGSRYLYPYFGGDIFVWSSLISTVLLALMVGYFLGGAIADRVPSLRVLAGVVFAAALYMACVPLAATPMLDYVLTNFGDYVGGLLISAFALSFVPVALLGMYSPFAVKLMLQSTATTGRTSGRVFGISTLGNIFGTLATVFWLVPVMGSRAITYVFAGVIGVCAVSLLVGARGVRSARRAILPLVLVLAVAEARAAEELVIAPHAAYPEGALVRGGVVYWAEMPRHDVMRWQGAAPEVFWHGEGCGPTSIAPYGDGFVILCHFSDEVVQVDRSGTTVARHARDEAGRSLYNPNDSEADGEGGVYFSSSGDFAREASHEGAVYYLRRDGGIVRVLSDLWYSNGVTLSRDGQTLYVSEHLARRVMAYPIVTPGVVADGRVFADLDAPAVPLNTLKYWLKGPDGLVVDALGRVYVCEYGAARILVFSPEGAFLQEIPWDQQYMTNLALIEGRGIVVTGSADNSRAPFPGKVSILPLPPALQ